MARHHFQKQSLQCLKYIIVIPQVRNLVYILFNVSTLKQGELAEVFSRDVIIFELSGPKILIRIIWILRCCKPERGFCFDSN